MFIVVANLGIAHSVCLYLCMSVCVFVMSLSWSLSVCLFVCVSLCVSCVCPVFCQSVCLSVPCVYARGCDKVEQSEGLMVWQMLIFVHGTRGREHTLDMTQCM